MKKLLQKYLPRKESITSKYTFLTVFGQAIMQPNLWKMKKKPVAMGLALGFFWSMIPMPFQMIPSALFSMLFKSNLPVALAACWISNPVTMPPIFYVNYIIGTMFLQREAIGYEAISRIDNFAAIIHILGDIWLPLYFGSIIVGVALALCGYLCTLTLWDYATKEN